MKEPRAVEIINKSKNVWLVKKYWSDDILFTGETKHSAYKYTLDNNLIVCHRRKKGEPLPSMPSHTDEEE